MDSSEAASEDLRAPPPPDAGPTASTTTLLRVFWPYLHPHRGRIAGAVVALLMVAGALLTMGRGLAYLVDEGLGRQDPALLDRAVVGTALIALVLAAGSYLRTTLVNQIGERVLADVRRAVFAHLMTLPPAWYETARTGDVLARITTDTAIVQTVMTSTISMAARNVILLVGGIVMVVLSSPKMSLVVLVVVPLVVVPLIILGRRLRRASRLAQDRLADVAVQAEETVASIRTVQAFARQQLMAERFDAAVGSSLDAALARVRLRGWMSGIIIFLVFPASRRSCGLAGRTCLPAGFPQATCPPSSSMPFLSRPRPAFCRNLPANCSGRRALPNGLPRPCRPRRICRSRRRRSLCSAIMRSPASFRRWISPIPPGSAGRLSARWICW